MDEALKNYELLMYAQATLHEAKSLSGHPWRTLHIQQQLNEAIERLKRFERYCRERPGLATAAIAFLPTLKTELALLKKENAPARASHKRIKGNYTYGK